MAGISLGLASRPTYDAAEPLLRNKQIEYERELRLKQLAQQAKLARQQQMMQGLGMLNQNMQQQAAQANQRAMQQEQIQAAMARDAQQQAAQGQSLLERQFNQMFANWQQQVAKAEANNMGFDPAHQPRMNLINESILKVDQAMAAGNIDPANGFRKKMALLQQLATFKPDTRIKTLQEQIQERMIRVGPNGQILGPQDPPVPGERLGTVNDKGVFDPFTPLPAPKTVDPAIAQQKMEDAVTKQEMAFFKAKMDRINDLTKLHQLDQNPPSSAEIEALVTKELAPLAESFQSRFGFPSKVLTPPPPPQFTPQMQGSLNRARQAIRAYGNDPSASPGRIALMDWANRTVKQLEPIEKASGGVQPQAMAPPPPMNINGQPLNEFGQYALSPAGQSVDESNFAESPVAGRMSYAEFDAARQEIESQVPTGLSAAEMAALPPGAIAYGPPDPTSIAFKDRGELLSNIPNPQPKPPRRGGSPRPGGGGAPRPMRPGQGGSQQKPLPPGRAQQAQPPQRKGMPLDRVLGSGDGKDRRGNTPPRTMLILKKGDPANKKLFDEVISKLPPEQAKQLYVEEVDPSQPAGPNNRMDLVTQHDVRAFPTLIREEWDGKKYVTADRMIAPRTSESLSEFMKNGKNPPPPNGNMAHTYVFLDGRTNPAASRQWAAIASQMTPTERANVTVFDASQPDSPTNELRKIADLNVKSFPAVIRGEWNGKSYSLKAEAQGAKALEPLKDIKTYREFARPDRDRHAEGAAKIAAEDAQVLEGAKAKQIANDAAARERLASQFDKNERLTGSPLGTMKVPATGEAGHENFRQAFDEWVSGGGKSGGLSLDQHIQQREASAVNTPEKAEAILQAYNDPKNPLNATNVAEARRIVERSEAVQRPPTDSERQAAAAGQKVLDIHAAQTIVARENPKFPIPRGQDKRLDAAKDLLRSAGNPPQVTADQLKSARDAVLALQDRNRGLTPTEESQLNGAKELLRRAESPKNPTNPQRVTESQSILDAASGGAQAGKAKPPNARPPVLSLPRGGGNMSAAGISIPDSRSNAPYTSDDLARDVQGELLQQGAGDGPAARTAGNRANSAARQQRIDRWIESVNTSDDSDATERQLAEDISRFRDQKGSAQAPDATRRMPAVTAATERAKLMQQIKQSSERLQQFIKQNRSVQQSQQQDRARQEQQKLLSPPTIQPSSTQRPMISPMTPPPMQRPMSSLPPLQPSRTAALRQGLATGVMKPGRLNLDTINAGLAAMGGNNPQPYTGGILGGMMQPRREPSGQLGMAIPPQNPLAFNSPYSPSGGFIQQPGYMGPQDFGYGGVYGSSPYDYGGYGYDGGYGGSYYPDISGSGSGVSSGGGFSDENPGPIYFEQYIGDPGYGNTDQGYYPAGDYGSFPDISGYS